MIDKNKLLSKIVAVGLNQKKISILLGISENTLSKKMNGKVPFNSNEIIAICEACSISDSNDKIDIFLTKTSQIWDIKRQA